MNDKSKPRKSSIVSKLILVILLLVIIGVGGLILNDARQADKSDVVLSHNFNCNSAVSNKQINAFISSYKTSQPASLKILVVRGSSAQDFSATCHLLTTSHGKLTNTEYSYADASPLSLVTQFSCRLVLAANKPAVADCGDGDNFSLTSHQY